MIRLFNRLFVGPFYARYAGSLLIVVLLAFGFMRPMDHEALITAIIGSPFLLGLVFLLWGLYTLNAAAFVTAQLAAPEHLFLHTFRLVPRPRRWLIWATVLAGLLLPVAGYAGWMLARAVHYGQWMTFVSLVVYIPGLIGAGTGAVDYRLHHPSTTRLRLPVPSFRLPYSLFFPAYWLRHEPLSLVLTKAGAGLLLTGVCRLYPTDDYDERLLLIGLLLAVLFHAPVSGQVSQFEGRYLAMLDNLPIPVFRRFGRYAIVYGLLWLPESGLLLYNCPADVTIGYVLLLWLTGWGWQLLIHGFTYGHAVDPDRRTVVVFAAFIVGLLAIMAGVPVLVWGLAGWGIALIRALSQKLPLKTGL